MKNSLALLGLFFAALCLGDEKATFREGKTWVTEHLENGGSLFEVTGLVRPRDWWADAEFVDVETREPLPDKFDWRTKVPFGLSPVRNQGKCGSCWAFGVTSVLESLLIIRHPNQRPLDLSEQELVSSCCSAGSCQGGYFRAFDYLRDKGQASEKDLPYLAKNSSCQKAEPAARIARWSYVSNPTTEKLKAAIYQYGPIACDVDGNFAGYKDGIYNRCSSGQINHMVNVVGWNDEGQYWIMRNSWGTKWGIGGYMHIKYTNSSGRKCNSLCSTAAFATLN